MLYLMIAFALVFVAVESSSYLAPSIHDRFWGNIIDRGTGPMTFRFFFQPVMAIAWGLYDGMRDVRLSRGSGVSTQTPLLPADELLSIARLFLLGLIIDLIYQIWVLGPFYPGESLLVTIPLVSIPYFAARRIVRAVGTKDRFKVK
jgi:hypothetical protein